MSLQAVATPAQDFLNELEAVYRKHGLFLSHEDTHGAFRVVKLGNGRRQEHQLAWLQAAYNDIKPQMYAKMAFSPRNASRAQFVLPNHDAGMTEEVFRRYGYYDAMAQLWWLKLSMTTNSVNAELGDDWYQYVEVRGSRMMQQAAEFVQYVRDTEVRIIKKRGPREFSPPDMTEMSTLSVHSGFMEPCDPHVEVVDDV